MAQVQILEKNPELAEYARKLRMSGEGFRSIADALAKKGLDITHTSVKNYFDKTDALGSLRVQGDIVLKNKIKDDVLKHSEQMKEINTMLWNIVAELRANTKMQAVPKYSLLLAAIDKLLKQMEVSNRIVERLLAPQPTNVVTNISYLDFSLKVHDYLPKLEQMGIIKILKPMELKVNLKSHDMNALPPGQIVDVPEEEVDDFIYGPPES